FHVRVQEHEGRLVRLKILDDARREATQENQAVYFSPIQEIGDALLVGRQIISRQQEVIRLVSQKFLQTLHHLSVEGVSEDLGTGRVKEKAQGFGPAHSQVAAHRADLVAQLS